MWCHNFPCEAADSFDKQYVAQSGDAKRKAGERQQKIDVRGEQGPRKQVVEMICGKVVGEDAEKHLPALVQQVDCEQAEGDEEFAACLLTTVLFSPSQTERGPGRLLRQPSGSGCIHYCCSWRVPFVLVEDNRLVWPNASIDCDKGTMQKLAQVFGRSLLDKRGLRFGFGCELC